MKTISRSNQIPCRRSFVGATVLGLLVLAGPAGASAVLCASTAQELQDDLTAASDGGTYAGQDVEISLVQGTYSTGAATGNGPFTYHSASATGNLYLVGGATGNCEDYALDASTTMLDGGGATQVLNIQSASAAVLIELLTIQNGESSTAGGGAAINTDVAGGTAQLYDNIFRNNHTASIGGGFAIDGAGGVVEAVGNLVVGNSADGGYGAGFVYSRSGFSASIKGNTVYKNTTIASGGTGGLYCCGTPTDKPGVYANIFWQNTNFGIDLEGTAQTFKYNDYGTVTGTITPDSTNLSTDPEFVDAAHGNYRLAGNSPLLGVYPAGELGGEFSIDLAGDLFPSPLSGYYDIGAYEDTIFTDQGFESN